MADFIDRAGSPGDRAGNQATVPCFQSSRATKGIEMSEFQKPDLLEVIEREGVLLKRRGRDSWGLCTLHEEKTPSFKVNSERQTFHCFGCGAHGDVIDFVRKLHGLSFSDALCYLGIRTGTYRPDPVKQRKRELLKTFRDWEIRTRRELTDEYRIIVQALVHCQTMDDVCKLAPMIDELPVIECKLDVLFYGSDRNKYELKNGRLPIS